MNLSLAPRWRTDRAKPQQGCNNCTASPRQSGVHRVWSAGIDACFTCHTDYALFGDYKAKWRGVHHVLVQYLGKIPKPEEIKLYTAYNNRECLHCHAGMRKYEEASSHHKNPEMLSQAATNQLSCISSGCHDTVHDVATLKDATFFGRPRCHKVNDR